MALTLTMLCGACASVSASGVMVPGALQRFAGAAQFLPLGLSSYAFSAQNLPLPTGASPEDTCLVLVVKAGGDFRRPKDVGYGAFRGVEVQDFGQDGLGNYYSDEPGPSYATACGYPIWFQAEFSGGTVVNEAMWWTHIDNRYRVMSAERADLEMALTRAGHLSEMVMPFQAVEYIADDADHVVCLLARPNDQTYSGRPVPFETMVIAMCTKARRLQVFHRAPLPSEFTQCFDAFCEAGPASTSEVGKWLLAERNIRPPLELLRFFVDVLFGIALFP
ncbi:MAG: hypothetical protein ABIP94_07910 [Planctomycetota bacterium]